MGSETETRSEQRAQAPALSIFMLIASCRLIEVRN